MNTMIFGTFVVINVLFLLTIVTALNGTIFVTMTDNAGMPVQLQQKNMKFFDAPFGHLPTTVTKFNLTAQETTEKQAERHLENTFSLT